MTHFCHNPDCPVEIPITRFFCQQCFSALPRSLQERLIDATEWNVSWLRQDSARWGATVQEAVKFLCPRKKGAS